MKENYKNGYVYFVQNVKTLMVKIGYTGSNPFIRIKSLSASNIEKLKVIGIIRGNRTTEKGLHSLYSHFRIKGEWFKPDVLEFLKNADTLDIKRLEKQSKPNSASRLREENSVFLKENLKYIFEGKNLSKIARELRISKSLLADWVSYRRTPSFQNVDSVLKIAKYANVNLETLFFTEMGKI